MNDGNSIWKAYKASVVRGLTFLASKLNLHCSYEMLTHYGSANGPQLIKGKRRLTRRRYPDRKIEELTRIKKQSRQPQKLAHPTSSPLERPVNSKRRRGCAIRPPL